MELIALMETLDGDSLKPAYLLQGKERFLMDLAIARFKKIVLSTPASRFNLHEMSGKEASGAAVVNQAIQVPMMAKTSLLIVEDAHKMTAEDHRLIDDYLSDPSPSTCLVMTAESFNAQRKLTKTAKAKGLLFDASPLKEAGIIPFIKWRAKERKVRLDQGAMAALSAVVGPDCAALDDAVERLGLFVGKDKTATEEEVSEVVTSVRQHSIFELVDAIGAREEGRAFSLLANLLSRQEEPIMINAMIARHFRQLLKTRIHMFLRTGDSELPSRVGAPPFMIAKLKDQARRFRGAELENALARLANADLELKSCKRKGALIIEKALVDLVSPDNRPL